MSQIISISIDLEKVDKTKLVKGKYLNLTVLVNDSKDQYDNDCSVIHQQTKEEREAKSPKKFLGNGRVVYNSKKNESPF